MERNNTDVIIDDKVYTISTDQDASYVRKLADYINEKMELLHRKPEYNKQPNGVRQMLVLMNMADDYCRMKEQANEAKTRYERQEAEFYNMKREMVNMQMAMANMKMQLQEQENAQAKEVVCPYLQSLIKTDNIYMDDKIQKAEAENEVKKNEEKNEPDSKALTEEKKKRPPYEAFTKNAAQIKK